jgi:hypothetical protein
VESKIVSAVGVGRKVGGYHSLRSDVRYYLRGLYARFLFGRGAWRLVPLWAKQVVILTLSRLNICMGVIAGGSMGNTMENDLLKLLFNATTIANVAINATSSPITIVAVSLHTADPGEAGDQTTSEAAYTSYARVSVTRDSSNWTVTNNSVSPAAAITFPAGTGGSGTATHFGVGKSASGAGVLWFSGTVTPNIVMGNGVTPQLTTATAITLD